MFSVFDGDVFRPPPAVTSAATVPDAIDVDSAVAALRNPNNADVGAMKNALELYNRIIACEDPQLKEPLQGAMQVRNWETGTVLLSTSSALISLVLGGI